MMKIIKRYKMFLIVLCVNIILGLILPELGKESFNITKSNLLQMLSVIPPIFVLLGLLDVWVEKETMMRYLGKGSAIKGLLIAFVMGSAAAGPLYASFPVATIMLKKGASLFNVFVFVGAWSTTKVPLLMFEMTSLGIKFTLTRLFFNIFGIVAIAYVTQKVLTRKEQDEVYDLAEKN